MWQNTIFEAMLPPPPPLKKMIRTFLQLKRPLYDEEHMYCLYNHGMWGARKDMLRIIKLDSTDSFDLFQSSPDRRLQNATSFAATHSGVGQQHRQPREPVGLGA